MSVEPSHTQVASNIMLHVDCDCFYAAVEMRDQPELIDVPIAIGIEKDRRGIVTTCNYPARKFGIKSAMPIAQARSLCPQLTVVPPRMLLYRQISAQVMAILRGYSLNLEVVSIDEAYMTIDPNLNANTIAQTIRLHIWQQLGITVSIGIARCKFLAKVASDWQKPNGLFEITPQQQDDFLQCLPVRRISGVGPTFQEQLKQLGITTCGDAQTWSLAGLVQKFGRAGAMLYQRCRGVDNRPIVEYRVRKSVSVERTFAEDLSSEAICINALPELYAAWQERVKRTNFDDLSLTPFVKIKFEDFTQTTVSDYTQSTSLESFIQLLRQALVRKNLAVRLIGIGAKKRQYSADQLSLFD